EATNASLTVANVQPNLAGNYTLVVTNGVGSLTSQVASLTVRVPPSIAQQPASLTVTQGMTATFSVSANGDQPLHYQWYLFGTNAVVQGTNASLILSNVQSSQAGNYTVTVTNAGGTATSAAAALTVIAPPQIATQPLSQV